MSHQSTPEWSRREFLRAGLVGGVTSLCLVKSLGCVGKQEASETPRETARKGFVTPRPSPWFDTLGNGRIRCQLCPRGCQLAVGERGTCRVRQNRDGRGYTLAYGNPAVVQEDPIERKPFFHVLPGTWSLSVATAGCNLACKFCEAWDVAQVAPENVHAYDMPPERLVTHARATKVRSISYSVGEPVVFYEYVAEVAALAKEAGLLNLMQTAGYIQVEPLRRLIGRIDAVNVDLKGFDRAFYRDIVGGELEPVLETLRLIREANVHIEITNIVIPTLNDDMVTIREMCRWIVRELGTSVPLHFVRFYPLYKLSDLPRTPVSTLDRARSIALDTGLQFVYVARVSGHEAENTYCPGCGKVVIRRVGFVVNEMQLENGRCRYCATNIPGRWL